VTWLTLESTSPTVRWRPLPQKSFLFDLMVNTLELISGPEVVRGSAGNSGQWSAATMVFPAFMASLFL
jgi:hypothetical protein